MPLKIPRRSVLTWLLLLNLAFLIPSGIFFARYLMLLHQGAEDLAQSRLRAQADATAGKIALVLGEYENLLSRVAQEFRGDPPAQSGRFVPQQFMDLHPEVINLGVRDRHANSLYTHLPNLPPMAEIQNFPWVQRAQTSDAFEVGDAFFAPIRQRWSTVLTYPVRDGNGQRSGFVNASVDLLKLNDRVMADVPTGYTVEVLDRHGRFLLRSEPLEPLLGQIRSLGAAPTQRGQNAGYLAALREDGAQHLLAYMAVPGTTWRVVVGMPLAQAMAPYYALRNEGFVLAGVTLILMLGLIWRISLVIARPIQALAYAADRVGQGDDSTRLALAGPSEVETVARQFNQLADTRMQTALALQESNARWRFALEGAGDGVWDWDVPSGKAFFSRRYRAMLGYADRDLHGTVDDWSALVHPEDLADAWQALRQHLEGQAAAYVTDYRMRCQDGSYKWILARGLVIKRDANGKALRVVGTNADLTERKQMELALQASRDDLEATLQAMPDLLFEMDLDGRYLAHKADHAELLVAPAEALIGKRVTDVLPAAAAATCMAALQEANAAGVSKGKQFELELPVGRRYFELSVARKAAVQGDTVRFIVLSRDITERQRAQAQKEADALALRDSLVREVHHRIKNNLQGIVGLLRESAHRYPQTEEPIARVVGQVQSIALIHGLQGKTPQEQVCLCELTRAVAVGVASLYGANIAVDIQNELDGFMLAEKEAVPIALVLNELLLNAVKHGDLALAGVQVVLRAAPAPWRVSVCVVNGGHWQPRGTQGHIGMQLVDNLLPRVGAQLTRAIRNSCIYTTLKLGAPVISPEAEGSP